MTSRSDGFRPVQYIGNKARMLGHIEAQVDALSQPSRPAVCDLFSGTGVVAKRLAGRRPVLANDIQHYSAVLTRAQCNAYTFTPTEVSVLVAKTASLAEDLLGLGLRPIADLEAAALETSDEAQLVEIVEHGSIGAWMSAGGHQKTDLTLFEQKLMAAGEGLVDAPYASMSTYYGGVYFGYEQAAYLDAATHLAHGLPEEARPTAVAAVLSTASQLVASVGGHFAQPVRVTTKDGSPKRAALSSLVRSRRLSAAEVFAQWLGRWSRLPPSIEEVNTTTLDFRDVIEALPAQVGTVYADPPYTRDHYSRFYHVLETIALADDPGISTVRIGGREAPSRGLYRVNRHQSPFNIISEAPGALQEMCASLASRSVRLVLSYSPIPDTSKPRDRVMTLETINRIVGSYYSNVEVSVPGGIGHSKFNASSLNAPVTLGAEVLISCR